MLMVPPFDGPPDMFQKLSHIPHPVLSEDNHYKPFTEVLGTETKEECPSLELKERKKKKNALPFTGCLQHVKNAGIVIQCSECEMWRLIFSKYKLKPDEVNEIQQYLDNYNCSCRSKLRELLPEKFFLMLKFGTILVSKPPRSCITLLIRTDLCLLRHRTAIHSC